jgi:hypothetical protein
MSDQPTTFPPSKLGEYIVIQDIAEGTFGKVKSKVASALFLASLLMLLPSGHTYYYRA